MWKSLSHPNVLNLVGVRLDEVRCSIVSEWMLNGNITVYVRRNAGNHLKLVGYNLTTLSRRSLDTFQIVDAVEGLKYLHGANIVHGDLKGVSLSVTVPRPPLM